MVISSRTKKLKKGSVLVAAAELHQTPQIHPEQLGWSSFKDTASSSWRPNVVLLLDSGRRTHRPGMAEPGARHTRTDTRKIAARHVWKGRHTCSIRQGKQKGTLAR